jgi:hypothetical protein
VKLLGERPLSPPEECVTVFVLVPGIVLYGLSIVCLATARFALTLTAMAMDSSPACC